MNKTSLDLARDRLAVARVCLQQATPDTTDFIEQLLTIDHHLSQGNDRRARAEVLSIITRLGDLKSAPETTAVPAENSARDPSEELLSGVADAIVQLSKAVDLLP